MEKKYCLNPRFKLMSGNLLLDKSTLIKYKLNTDYLGIIRDIEEEPQYIKDINGDIDISRKVVMINQLLEKRIILCVDDTVNFKVIF